MLGQTREIRVLRTLGEGGFGAVYLVEIAGPDGFVQRAALKVLHQAMARHGDVAGRQRDEARLLAQLNHDHIVKVLDLGDHEGRPAVLMEYVDGIDAHGLLQQGPLPPRVALEVVAAVASALDAASNAVSPRTGRPLNVVHRDIKPANILVTAQGGVKVLDFGVARADFDREGATKSVLFGTARFMAPEMWLDGSSSPAVDVYALGVTTLELLGAEPFARPPLHPELFQRHVDEAVDGLNVEASERWLVELRRLLRAMLAFQHEDRPKAAEVHDRALELAERAPGSAVRRWARLVVPRILASRAGEPTPSPEPSPSSSPAASTLFTPTPIVPSPPGSGPRRTPLPEPVARTEMEASGEASPPPASAPTRTLAPVAAPVSGPETLAVAVTAEASEARSGPERSSPARPGRAGRGTRYGLVGGLALTLGLGALWWGSDGPEPSQGPTLQVDPIGVDPTLTEAEAPPPAEEPVAEEPSAEQPADPLVARASSTAESPVARGGVRPGRSAPTPSAPASAEPAPSPAEPTPSPAEAAPALSCASGAGRVSIDLSSNPLGALVYGDGALLGTTPLSRCGLPEGRVVIKMVFSGHSTTHEVRVSSRSARGFIWDVATNRWDVTE